MTAGIAGMALGVWMTVAAAPPPPSADPGLSIWTDPAFQREFLGSYGVAADVEPRLSPVERAALEKLLPLLAGDQAAAIAELELLATPTASALFDFTLGNLQFQRENLEAAGERFRIAVEKHPSFRRAHKNLAMVQVRAGKLQEAARSLTRVIELGGGDGSTYGLLGYAYQGTERPLQAETAYRQAILLQPEVLDWKVGLVQTLFRQQRHGEVAVQCDELLARAPERADLWLLQANAFLGLGQPEKAAQNYEVVRRLGKATANNLYMLGDLYVNQGLFDLAAGAYGEAFGADAGQALERPLRSIEALAQRGGRAQAKELLARARTALGDGLDEAERRALLKLEARLAAMEGGGAEAVPALEEIVALDPLDGEALLLLGQHYARSGETEKALFYLERAENLEGVEAEARLRHAQILVQQGRHREALPLLKRAQELKPRDDLQRYLEQVERVARGQT